MKMIMILLLLATPVFAADLITDPMTGVVIYDVEVDGTVIQAVSAQTDGSLKFNVDSLATGVHTFRVKPTGEGGWPANWSVPFEATKPATATGLTIVP